MPIALDDQEAQLLDSLPTFEARGLSKLEIEAIRAVVHSRARLRIARARDLDGRALCADPQCADNMPHVVHK